jgi:hypothetical protein
MRSIVQRDPGEGDSPQTELVETPPHPNPLPASGARESAPARARRLDEIRNIALQDCSLGQAADPLRSVRVLLGLGHDHGLHARHDGEVGELAVVIGLAEAVEVADRDAAVGIAVRAKHEAVHEQA